MGWAFDSYGSSCLFGSQYWKLFSWDNTMFVMFARG